MKAPPAHHDLHNTSAVGLVLIFFGAVGCFVAFSELAGNPAPTCSWCESNAFDEGVRRLLYVEASRTVGLYSHLFSMVLAPALAIAAAVGPGYRSTNRSHGTRNLAILITTLVLTVGCTDGAKKLFNRERPGFHYGRQALVEAANVPLERNLSFFSGDTAIAFSLVAVAFAICHLRGYRPHRWLAISAVGAAVLSGLLRIAADMHWATDVMSGAAVGIIIGAGLPLLLHRRRGAPT